MNQELLQALHDYVKEHPESFERVAIDIDSLINEFMESYDGEIEKIKHDIINDPKPIANPEQEMLTRIEQAKKDLYDEFVKKLEALTQPSL